MAQETRVAPITLNDDASKIYMDLGDNIQKQNMQQKQLDVENAKMAEARRKELSDKQFEASKALSGEMYTTVKNNTARDEYMPGILKGITEARLKGIDGNTIYSTFQPQIQAAASYGNKLDALDKQADDYIKSLPEADRKNLNVAQFKTMFLGKALYKADANGKPIKKLPNEIDDTTDYVSSVLSDPNAHTLTRYGAGQEAAATLIKESPSTTTNATVTEQNGIKRNTVVKDVQYKPSYQRVNKLTGQPELDTDVNGIIKESVSKPMLGNAFISNDTKRDAIAFANHYNDAWAHDDGKTLKTLMGEMPKGFSLPEKIDINDAGVMSQLQRIMLTHTLTNLGGGTSKNKESSINVYPPSSANPPDTSHFPDNPMYTVDYIQSQNKNGNNDVTGQLGAFNVLKSGKEFIPADKIIINGDNVMLYRDRVKVDAKGDDVLDASGNNIKESKLEKTISVENYKILLREHNKEGFNSKVWNTPKTLDKPAATADTFSDWKKANPKGNFADYKKATNQ